MPLHEFKDLNPDCQNLPFWDEHIGFYRQGLHDNLVDLDWVEFRSEEKSSSCCWPTEYRGTYFAIRMLEGAIRDGRVYLLRCEAQREVVRKALAERKQIKTMLLCSRVCPFFGDLPNDLKPLIFKFAFP